MEGENGRAGNGRNDNRDRNGNGDRNGENPPPGGSGSAASVSPILWVYEGQTTKVPVFFDAFAPFQAALSTALEEQICNGSFGAGSVVGLDDAMYYKNLRAFRLTCNNTGSVRPIKELVLGLTVGEKVYRAWGAGEEPGSFDMVAFLSPQQKTPLERVKQVMAHHNPGIPMAGMEVLAIWEQGRSRKVDLKADQEFYNFARNNKWRLKYTMGYMDVSVGIHGLVTACQENQVSVLL
jgi:hypothetical protein